MKTLIRIIIFCLLLMPSVLLAQPKMRKNEIKVALLSIASGSSKVTYERLVGDYQSIELTVGVIGLGFDILKDSDPKGTSWRAAYKFIFPNQYNAANQLCGFYVKPELVWSNFTYDKRDEDFRTKSSMVALFACSGYQWARKRFIIDGYVGIGNSFGRESDTNYHHGFILWKCFGTYCKNIAMTFAIKFGYSF